MEQEGINFRVNFVQLNRFACQIFSKDFLSGAKSVPRLRNLWDQTGTSEPDNDLSFNSESQL